MRTSLFQAYSPGLNIRKDGGHMDSCLMDVASLWNILQNQSYGSENIELDIVYTSMAVIAMKL